MKRHLLSPALIACLAIMASALPCEAQKPAPKLQVQPFRYVIKTGDTPSGLAGRWGLPVVMIARKGETLRVGGVLTIPLKARRTIGNRDSLWDLSRHYGVSIETLAKFNSIVPPYTLVRGHVLLVPKLRSRLPPKRKKA
jgi:hypothetical protein